MLYQLEKMYKHIVISLQVNYMQYQLDRVILNIVISLLVNYMLYDYISWIGWFKT